MTVLVVSSRRAGAGTDPTYPGLEAAFDGVSRRHLSRTAVGPGWDCWEVGAGGGGVARARIGGMVGMERYVTFTSPGLRWQACR